MLKFISFLGVLAAAAQLQQQQQDKQKVQQSFSKNWRLAGVLGPRTKAVITQMDNATYLPILLGRIIWLMMYHWEK